MVLTPELMFVVAGNAVSIFGAAAGLAYKLGKIEGKLNGLPEDVDNLKEFKAAAEVQLDNLEKR